MDQARAQEIADRWMMPTEESSYMGGLEKRPILASASGSTVVDTQGKEYLDFQSGQMGAALGHRHPASWPPFARRPRRSCTPRTSCSTSRASSSTSAWVSFW